MILAPAKLDIKIIKGATFQLVFIWKTGTTSPRTPVPMPGWGGTAQFQPVGATWFEIACDMTQAAVGQVSLVIAPAATAVYTWEEGDWNLEVTDPTGKIWRLLEGLARVRD